IRHAAGHALRLVEQLRIKRAVFAWPDALGSTAQHSDIVMAVAEGTLLGGYEFDKYVSHTESKFSCQEVALAVRSTTAAAKKALLEAQVISQAVNDARDMQNDNSDDVNPKKIEERAKKIAKDAKIRMTVISGDAAKKAGLNLLQAVGRASPWPPRLIVLEYFGAAKKHAPLAIVGKGITFDTGGVNLKPAHGMLEQMHLDMSGAATVLAVIRLAAQLKLKTNLIAAMPIAENALGGNAYKPGSVYTAQNGTSVEVTNTDAEGRLVLADANAYVAQRYKPTAIIDIATLTGAVLIALGEHHAGLTSNHDDLSNGLFNSSRTTGELIWPLPLTADYRAEVKGKKSDLVNAVLSKSARADAIQAAAFLERFAGEYPFALIDMAGTSMRSYKRGYTPEGGTGFGVRLLLDYIKQNPHGPKAKGWGSRGLGRYGR
ncbi:MAG: leucyl aminopeptidase, partial [bacterium]|nr:leucyl aminopeptidase [bacterium]